MAAAFLDRVDPELLASIRQAPPWDLSDIRAARQRAASSRAQARSAMALPDVVTVQDHRIDDGENATPFVRVYTPRDTSGVLPCLYWMHGGGFVLGHVDQDDQFLCRLVSTLNCVAVSVEYRLAPEHPYPAAFEDCFRGLEWTFRNAARFGIDQTRIAVGGVSAGGGLAAAIALRARSACGVEILSQLLLSPMLDDRQVTPSSRSIDFPNVWNRTLNGMAWRAYLGERATETVPEYAAPARATDLVGLPPAFVAVGELDPFLDENLHYAQRLLQAGVPTELHVYPGAPHGFATYVPTADVSQRFTRDCDEALRRSFRRPTP